MSLTIRSSGVLLHPTSLPGKYCIGDLGTEAYDFIDWLQAAGQTLWQVLPLGPTGAGDSPYQPFSSFAGNVSLIALDSLISEGLLAPDEVAEVARIPDRYVDYGCAYHAKRPLLALAADRFLMKASESRLRKFTEFAESQASWLDSYALFMAIKTNQSGLNAASGSWAQTWPQGLAKRDPLAVSEFSERNAALITRQKVLQFIFNEQWNALKRYANDRGIAIIGDLPIFVAYDSADVWSNPELFALDDDFTPRATAGVPPDYFSPEGQFWGNPLYDWERNEAEGFSWWIRRIEACLERYDHVRIDHFRGFEACWAIPRGASSARAGTWEKAPGTRLFKALSDALGPNLPIIAEDLGFITPEVIRLRDDFSLPGMKILQFAFDANEAGAASAADNVFLPHNYPVNSVVYSGTHDNDTLQGWLSKATPAELSMIDRYVGHVLKNRSDALIREALKSVAAFAVFPIQDLLELGSDCRMNTPSTANGNWNFRLLPDELIQERATWFKELCGIYGRNQRSSTRR